MFRIIDLRRVFSSPKESMFDWFRTSRANENFVYKDVRIGSKDYLALISDDVRVYFRDKSEFGEHDDFSIDVSGLHSYRIETISNKKGFLLLKSDFSLYYIKIPVGSKGPVPVYSGMVQLICSERISSAQQNFMFSQEDNYLVWVEITFCFLSDSPSCILDSS